MAAGGQHAAATAGPVPVATSQPQAGLQELPPRALGPSTGPVTPVADAAAAQASASSGSVAIETDGAGAAATSTPASSSKAPGRHLKGKEANMTAEEQAAALALQQDKAKQKLASEEAARLAEQAYEKELQAYEQNQDRALAMRLQSGRVVARVGSLTVNNLGFIKVEDDLFHTELAIYPVGYNATRLYFAPGMVPKRGGGAIGRCLYHCEIKEDPSGPGPLFVVRVNGLEYSSKHASEAWERATMRPLRERKKLKVHANEGQCDNVTEMFMACSYAVDGDYMFGVTIGPVAKALESLHESLLLFNYHPRFKASSKFTRINPSGCARSEPFKRKKKMSTAKVMRTAGNDDDGMMAEDPTVPSEGKEGNRYARQHDQSMRVMYEKLRADPHTIMRRSPIHNLGLFATQKIHKNEMVIEYMGEICREEVGDIRDQIALDKGKSTYMFRLDENTIVDAMFKGNESRFINHSCEPNCYTKVVTIDGVKHILFFAGKDIQEDAEITYDYKLPIEDVKIPCHCGASQCRGYLN